MSFLLPGAGSTLPLSLARPEGHLAGRGVSGRPCLWLETGIWVEVLLDGRAPHPLRV